MDAALELLLPMIRDAVLRDGHAESKIDASLNDLVPQMRDALQRDEATAGEEERIASRVAQLIPSLQDRFKRDHAAARTRIERDQPWGLVPLDVTLDLLSPLGKARNEVVHTRCLAYLLDHRNPHGLGIRCLRELLALLGRRIPGEDIFEQLGRETEENNKRLRRIKVYAERCVESLPDRGNAAEERRCDMWLELIEERRSLIVIIENKVDAGEHGSQLSAYEQAVYRWQRQNRCPSNEAKFVFLTPNGRQPDSREDQKLWDAIGYRELAAALAQAGRDAPEPGRTFLMLYVSTILKHVLGIEAQADELNLVRQLSFMRAVQAVIDQGAPHE